jgi:hypothetical protein
MSSNIPKDIHKYLMLHEMLKKTVQIVQLVLMSEGLMS